MCFCFLSNPRIQNISCITLYSQHIFKNGSEVSTSSTCAAKACTCSLRLFLEASDCSMSSSSASISLSLTAPAVAGTGNGGLPSLPLPPAICYNGHIKNAMNLSNQTMKLKSPRKLLTNGCLLPHLFEPSWMCMKIKEKIHHDCLSLP